MARIQGQVVGGTVKSAWHSESKFLSLSLKLDNSISLLALCWGFDVRH